VVTWNSRKICEIFKIVSYHFVDVGPITLCMVQEAGVCNKRDGSSRKKYLGVAAVAPVNDTVEF
jgi:hypothetical protein